MKPITVKSSRDGALFTWYEFGEGVITPLMMASRDGKIKRVKTLLRQGADVHAKNIHGRTALWFAQQNGETEVIALLKAAGAKE